ncbi:MAG: hypothetical protein HY898_11760 [Deltaproteobacteria bacterium]|nr:hypothetical protein [Deltaproteobacteria bacterium]
MRLVTAAWILLVASPAFADECTQGWVSSLDVPRDGATVRPGAHFRVLEYWGCSPVSGGPKHQYRLQNGSGAEIPFRTDAWADHYLELVPEPTVAQGDLQLEVRRPVDKTTLGPFEKLARVQVAGTPDTMPPIFQGLSDGKSEAIEGSVMLSPCQAIPGWQLQTRLRFAQATDAGSHHDELIYLLERARPGADTWERVTTLRPTPQGEWMTFSWKDERGWGESWVYRMHVRDMAGHETIGAKTVAIRNPELPTRVLARPDRRSAALEPSARGRCTCGAAGRSLGAEEFAALAGIAGGITLWMALRRRRSGASCGGARG